MAHAKPISTRLQPQEKLSKEDCPTIDTTSEEMKNVSFNSVCKSLVYIMVAIHPDIAQAIGLVRRFMS